MLPFAGYSYSVNPIFISAILSPAAVLFWSSRAVAWM